MKISIKFELGLYIIATIVFIVLKLCEVISWEWVWVLSPLWIGIIINIVFASIGIAMYMIAENRERNSFKIPRHRYHTEYTNSRPLIWDTNTKEIF